MAVFQPLNVIKPLGWEIITACDQILNLQAMPHYDHISDCLIIDLPLFKKDKCRIRYLIFYSSLGL